MFDQNPPALCGPGTSSRTVFAEELQGRAGRLDQGRARSSSPAPAATPWVADSTLPKDRAGDRGLRAGARPGPVRRQRVGTSPRATRSSARRSASPRARPWRRKLSFDHYVATEFGFDGGNVKYRTGPKWKIDPGLGVHVQRAGTTLDGRRGQHEPDGRCSRASPAPTVARSPARGARRQVNLTALGVKAGQDLRLRFDIGRDGCGGIDGWYVDDVTVTVCQSAGAGRPAGTAAGRRN